LDVLTYLDRINYRGSLEPTHETLRALHIAHLFSVPFENLSIHIKEPIVLNDESLYKKIVEKRRGGFCYELNGLFCWLLRSLGFDVKMLSAGVMNAEGKFGPDFDHLTLLVTLDERYLADVGFGDSFLEPLLFDSREAQMSPDGKFYRIIEDEDALIMQVQNDGWKSQYRFTLTPYEYADYEEMCLWQQTSPDSHFVKNRICSLPTKDGRVTLSGNRFIKTVHGKREEKILESEEEVSNLLKEVFGIELNQRRLDSGVQSTDFSRAFITNAKPD
jgi:N-hydroxyarylamine O-acetyltransferase